MLESKLPKEYGRSLDIHHDHLHKLDDYQLDQLEQEIMAQIAASAGFTRVDSDTIDAQLIEHDQDDSE